MPLRPLPLLGLLLLVACRPAETASQADDRMRAESDSLRPMFDSAVAAYNRQYNSAQVDPLVTRYAPDAHIMPPNAAPIDHRDSLRTLFAAAFRSGPNGTIDVRVERIIRNGPLAVVRAHWTFVPPATSPMPADTGSSVTIWHQGADGWQIIEDIWHSDLPVRLAQPAPPPPPVRRR